MSQYTYLHGGGKKNTDGSGPILPGICCSATQWSFKGETNGSFWIWSQHEQMCHGTAFQPWHFLFFMDVIWYFSHTICGINGLHSRNSVLLHCCFQPGSHCGCEHLSMHKGNPCILPWGLTLYCSNFWAISISAWIGETPEEAEARSPVTLRTSLFLVHRTIPKKSKNPR